MDALLKNQAAYVGISHTHIHTYTNLHPGYTYKICQQSRQSTTSSSSTLSNFHKFYLQSKICCIHFVVAVVYDTCNEKLKEIKLDRKHLFISTYVDMYNCLCVCV